MLPCHSKAVQEHSFKLGLQITSTLSGASIMCQERISDTSPCLSETRGTHSFNNNGRKGFFSSSSSRPIYLKPVPKKNPTLSFIVCLSIIHSLLECETVSVLAQSPTKQTPSIASLSMLIFQHSIPHLLYNHLSINLKRFHFPPLSPCPNSPLRLLFHPPL